MRSSDLLGFNTSAVFLSLLHSTLLFLLETPESRGHDSPALDIIAYIMIQFDCNDDFVTLLPACPALATNLRIHDLCPRCAFQFVSAWIPCV